MTLDCVREMRRKAPRTSACLDLELRNNRERHLPLHGWYVSHARGCGQACRTASYAKQLGLHRHVQAERNAMQQRNGLPFVAASGILVVQESGTYTASPP